MRALIGGINFTLGFILVVTAWPSWAQSQRLDMFALDRPETRSELEIRMQAELFESQCRAHREQKFKERWPAFEQKIIAEIYAQVGYRAAADQTSAAEPAVRLIQDQTDAEGRELAFANSQTKENCRADYEVPAAWVEDVPVTITCAAQGRAGRRLNFKLNVETGEIEYRKLHWFYRTPVWQN